MFYFEKLYTKQAIIMISAPNLSFYIKMRMPKFQTVKTEITVAKQTPLQDQ